MTTKRKRKIKLVGKQDFGTWLKEGKIVEVTEHWALFACDKGYAELLKNEARKLKGLSLLKKYGLPPFKQSYSRSFVLDLINRLEEKEVKTILGEQND